MKTRSLVALAGIIFLTIISSSCQQQTTPTITPTEITPKLETKNPHIRGEIVEIIKNNGKISGLSIVGKKEADTTYDKAFVGITDKTLILIMVNSKYKIISSDDLKVNQVVAVLFTGPIATSYPVQGYADEILILQ
ncbi:MAG TPA: DUF3221 domain-containing protein [Anaerolineaceae bacterium]